MLAAYHPQVVHFAVALLVVGVAFRLVSLLGRPAFAGPAALTLLLLGTGASVLAVKSGTDAHGPVERIPGAREAVTDHEEWGERTRNVFLVVVAIELVALVMRRHPRVRGVYIASAILGLVGVACLYEAGEHGGRLVYSFAGGVGTRSGDPADVQRLLLAGLYQQSQVDRKAGRHESAAALIEQAAQRFPDNAEVGLLAAESLVVDRRDPKGALAALDRTTIPSDNTFLRVRSGMLRADALEAAGQREGAVAVLQTLASEFPANTRLKQRIQALKSAPPPQGP